MYLINFPTFGLKPSEYNFYLPALIKQLKSTDITALILLSFYYLHL